MNKLIGELEKALEEEVQVSLNAAKKILELKQEIKNLKLELIEALNNAGTPVDWEENEEIHRRTAELFEDLGDDYE